MRCGLFGKLPAKRDFIAVAAPRPFLRLWEPWLARGMTESRAHLSEQPWEAAYLSAPIWRFWLGADLCGTTVVGALMPSMDAVGRYFPLTLVASAASGGALDPPSLAPREAWFDKGEQLLLAALEPQTAFETTAAGLEELAGAAAPADGANDHPVALYEASFADETEAPRPLAVLFDSCLAAMTGGRAGETTFWWTVGGPNFPPAGWAQNLMPDGAVFSSMLTGRFARRSAGDIAMGMTGP